MHQKVVRLALLVALGFGLAPAAVIAQSASGADLEGTIRDDTGAALPGVTIVATNVDTGVQRTTFSNADGRYRLPALPVGPYTLTVSLEGFATVERTGLILQIGQVATIDLVLPLAGLEETVTVTQAAPIVETGRTQVGAVVSRTEIDNLPINGRNFLDFSTTVAGVTGQQMSGQGSGLSFNGQRSRSNNISIDGADSNGQLNGNTRLTLSQEAVREFQVVTSQFAPEFGRAGGGLVNIVSKSGTNLFAGNGFLFVRDESFDARNAFVPAGQPKPQFERQNFGGTFGGPIVRNRTFFFGSVERVDRSESGVVSISDASVQAVNAALAARPIPGSNVRSISNGVYPISLETTLVSLKIDHSFNPNNNLAVRYIYGKTLEENAGGVGVGGLIDTSGGGGLDGEDQSLFLSWTRIFGSSMFSETRFQFAPRDLQQYANDAVGPRVTISGVATFGRNVNFPVLLNEDRYEFKQDFSIDRGRHFFKFGADVTRVNAFSSFPISFAGSFTFGSLATFLAGTPTTFTQGFGNPAMDLPNTLVGLYWQDTFKVGNSLTLVYGLRYDYDGQPQGITRDPNNPVEAPLQTGINRDKNNLAPRLGVTYDPFGDGRTVIRGGYGKFYDKIFLLVARNALIARQSVSLSGTAAAQRFALGAFPESQNLPPGFTLTRPNINIADPAIELPYNHQFNLGVERQVGTHWAAGANFVYVRGENLLRSDNINLGPPTVLTAQNAASLGVANPNPQQIGRPYYGTTNRIDPLFNNVQQVSSASRSRYWGLQFVLQKRMSHGLELRANYTLSEAKDDSSDFTQAEQPNDPYNRDAEFNFSAEHQRHRFTLTNVWELPFRSAQVDQPVARVLLADWVFASSWTMRSGAPRNPSVGADVNGDGNSGTDRPFIDGVIAWRNSFVGPDYRVIDVRLSKRIRTGGRTSLLVLAEAFNLLNRVNYGGVNMTWGTTLAARDTYGTFTSANDPRQLQFGVKFEF
jgi:hypothetical protein